jgi:hypothetical protein
VGRPGAGRDGDRRGLVGRRARLQKIRGTQPLCTRSSVSVTESASLVDNLPETATRRLWHFATFRLSESVPKPASVTESPATMPLTAAPERVSWVLPNPIGSKPNVSDGRPGCRLTAGFENIWPQRLK